MNRGQPTKLTPKASKDICDAIRAGVPKKYACAAGGVAISTLMAWQARARDAIAVATEHCKDGQALKFHPSDQPYVDFLEASTLAESEAIATLIVLIRQQAPTDWRAALALLKIKAPGEFAVGAEVKHTHTGEVTHQVDVGARVAVNPKAQAAALAFAEAIAEEAPDDVG